VNSTEWLVLGPEKPVSRLLDFPLSSARRQSATAEIDVVRPPRPTIHAFRPPLRPRLTSITLLAIPNFMHRGGDWMGGAGGRALVLRPGEGRAIDVGDFQMSVKATKEETNGARFSKQPSPRNSGRLYRLITTQLKLSMCSKASTSFLLTGASSSVRPDRLFSSRPACLTGSGSDTQLKARYGLKLLGES